MDVYTLLLKCKYLTGFNDVGELTVYRHKATCNSGFHVKFSMHYTRKKFTFQELQLKNPVQQES
jgi:hypothetical protein